MVDTAIAVAATVAAVWALIMRDWPGPGPGGLARVPFFVVLGIALTTAPLAFRRRYPATSFGIMMAAVIATSSYSTTVTFAAGGWRVRARIPLEPADAADAADPAAAGWPELQANGAAPR